MNIKTKDYKIILKSYMLVENALKEIRLLDIIWEEQSNELSEVKNNLQQALDKFQEYRKKIGHITKD